MKSIRHLIISLIAGLLLISCNRPPHYVTLLGKYKHFDTDSISVCKFTFNQAYSYFKEYKAPLNEDATFKFRVPIDTATVIFLDINHTHYPIYAAPGQKITLSIDQDTYPKSVKVRANNSQLNSQYNNSYQYYQYQNRKVQAAIDNSLPDFLKGNADEILKLEKLRIRIAMEDFSNTPFDIYVFKAMGDYVIRSLENINNHEYRDGKTMEKKREKIIDEANEMGFFTIRSLVAQQEKLDNFINEYLLSYKIEGSHYSSLQSEIKENNQNYNLDNKKLYKIATSRLLNHISDQRAKAYLALCLYSHQQDHSADISSHEKNFEEFASRFSNRSSYNNYLQLMIGKEKQ